VDQLARTTCALSSIFIVASNPSIADRLAALQGQFGQNRKQFGVSDATLATALAQWQSIIGFTNREPITAGQVHAYRLFLSHFAPNFVPRDENGTVGGRMSPAQAIYLLDILLASGTVPVIDRKSILQPRAAPQKPFNAASYQQTMQQYYAGTPPAVQAQNLYSILQPFGLVVGSSVKN
jgi:hypothetical protein